uniref:Structural maintenance of chromosomes protein 5 n=1 Tax=Anthurium amnicola TaxID=1678845 RepID=A0A1D1YS75_9ARAE
MASASEEERRSAKRPKLRHHRPHQPHPHHRGEDDYVPGNIVEIEIHNFMTYDHLTCKPGSRLNLVIGPNGSGKSSLVCAIALGLGGDPQILGRASSVGAFVKRGEDSGYIKISLRGYAAEEQIVIIRKIDTQNKSEWLLNGLAVPKRDVIEIIHKFNIQVNNLTQFLPQDRVCEFAKLTPIQLLEETEKAVGDPELPVQHHALVEKSQEMKRLEVTVKQNGDTLNQLKALNAEQEKDVERVRQRNQLLAKVESMKKKLPWLRYDLKKMEYIEAQKQEAEAKRKLDEAAKILNDLMGPIEEKKQERAENDKAAKKLGNAIAENANSRKDLIMSETRKCTEAQVKYSEIEDLQKQEESRQQRIAKAEDDLVAAEIELANLPVYVPPKDELERLGAKICELEVAANQKKFQRSEKDRVLNQHKVMLKQCLERLKDMESKNAKLLEALRNSGSDKIFEAYDWLKGHHNELRKRVYGPVLLEVNIKNRDCAPYLEAQVPNYIWKSFITQDPSDRDFLVKNLKSFGVPVLNFVNEEGGTEMPLQLTSKMHDLGIYTRLDQVFDAPPAVKKVLNSQCPLETSYVGTRETDQRADEVLRLGIMDLWTPDSHYRWSKSRYGGHVSAFVDPVQHSRLFLYNSDAGDVDRMKSRKQELEATIAEMDGSLKSLQMEQRQLEDEAAKLQKQREEIVNIGAREKRKRREMENLVDQRRRRFEYLKKEDGAESNMQRLTDQAAQLNMDRFELAIRIKNLLIDAISLKRRFVEKQMMSIELDAQIRGLDVDLKQFQRTALQASTCLDQCKKKTEYCRQQLYDAKRHAESIAIITEQVEQEFLEMPGTIEELEVAIEDTISQANSILFLNQNILEEYQARQNKINAIERKLEADGCELQRCLSEINMLKEKWFPTLKNLVAKINETFGRNFQEMAVAGEVSLDEHEMDFDKYGILIKVKFRQTGELQVLSAHHQSGGERSVSTILYLVSLQDLTNCPFRVVDEINQGMDPINERKMFQQLVRASSQPSTPQCFLLTPKLLPDLEYSDACSILNIMNGPWLEKPSKAWSSGDCWRGIMGLKGEA